MNNHLNRLTLAREVRLALAFGDILSRWDPLTVLFGWVKAVSAVLTSETNWVGEENLKLELLGIVGIVSAGFHKKRMA